MQIAVRLGRKAGDHLLDAAGIEIGLDDVADEVAPGLGRRGIAACLVVLAMLPRFPQPQADDAATGGFMTWRAGSMSIALSHFAATVVHGPR